MKPLPRLVESCVSAARLRIPGVFLEECNLQTNRFKARAAMFLAAAALMLMSFAAISTEGSAATATGTAGGGAAGAGATVAPAKTGNAGLIAEDSGNIALPLALAAGAGLLAAGGWMAAGARRSRQG